MSITIATAGVTGASGTTTRTRKFAVKVQLGTALVRAVQAVPSGGKWSVTWNALDPGNYVAEAGTASKAFTVAAPPPPDGLFPGGPFRTPVPSNPQLDVNSSAVVNAFLAQGPFGNLVVGTEGTPVDWGRPFYKASDTDPTVTVHGGLGGSWPGGSGAEGNVIHVPPHAQSAGASHWENLDGGVTIEQPNKMLYSAWRAENGPNGLTGRAYQWEKIDGTKSGAANDGGRGIGQAGLGTRQGQIAYEELVVDKNIPHALFCEVNKWCGRRWPGWYPDDGKRRGGQVYGTNDPPQGGHFYLAYSAAEIDALAVPGWHKVILHALATYGLYIYDNGGAAHALLADNDWPAICAGQPPRWLPWAQANLPGHFDNNAGKTIYSMDIQQSGKVDWGRLRFLAR